MRTIEPSLSSEGNRKVFWGITTALFIIAVALRWTRLDAMTFRFDQAAVAFRTMENLRSGLQFTGIVNSLGFHNGPGYVWTLLPAFAVTPDPRYATAFHGLLASTMVFPLAMLGRRYRNDMLRWAPAVLAAVLPASVFAGRNLWAQYLLPPVASWALLALHRATDTELAPNRRRNSAAAALALLGWGTSIHFSAGIFFLLSLGHLFVFFKHRRRQLLIAAIPAALICLTMTPSLLDYIDQRINPREKPHFAEEFEAILPDPLPWWARIPDSVEYTFSNPSFEAVPIEEHLSPITRATVHGWDLVCLTLFIVSAGFALFMVVKRQGNSGGPYRNLATLLAAWILFPAVVGGLFVERVNAGYFLGSQPAVWLLVLFLPAKAVWRRYIASPIFALLLGGGIVISASFISIVSALGHVPGNYYITYSKQLEVVRYLVGKEIPAGRVTHLSGDWFERSYKYIHRHVEPAPETKTNEWALLEDQKVRPDQPERLKVFWALNPVEFGPVGVKLMPSRGAAATFTWNYYELPPR